MGPAPWPHSTVELIHLVKARKWEIWPCHMSLPYILIVWPKPYVSFPRERLPNPLYPSPLPSISLSMCIIHLARKTVELMLFTAG